MKTTKIAILGKGNVGSALARGLSRTYSHVEAVGHNPEAQRKAAAAADIVILAVPFPAVGQVAQNVASVAKGKIVVDATNALDAHMNLALGFSTSGAEELQKKLPGARGQGIQYRLRAAHGLRPGRTNRPDRFRRR